MTVRLTGWQPGLPDIAVARALLDECTAVDRVAPLSGHVVDSLATFADNPGAASFMAAFDGERLVGVAVVPGADPAELAVLPQARGHGVGGMLLDHVLEYPALEYPAKVWAHGSLPAARALAAGRGLLVVRELVQMRRSLSAEIPPLVLPGLRQENAVRLRTFIPGQDEEAFLAVNARAFSWHPEQGRLDRAGFAADAAQDWFDPVGFFLAVDSADRVLGFHWTKVHSRDPTPGDRPAGPIGEIYVLGVDPESPVQGLGRPLSIAGLSYLRDRGLATVMLYVEGDNARAVRLYEKLGFERYLTDVVYQVPGT